MRFPSKITKQVCIYLFVGNLAMLQLPRRGSSVVSRFFAWTRSTPPSSVARERARRMFCSGFALLAILLGGTAYGQVITSFSPTSGPVGTTITVTGGSFTTTTSDTVIFPGACGTLSCPVSTTATVLSRYGLTVVVPSGATTGVFQVYVGGRTGPYSFSPSPFTVITGPKITGFSPASGVVGDTVTITGTGFGATPSANSVTFNGTPALVSCSTATSLSVIVPANATTGSIAITVNGQSATSTSSFTVSCPSAVQVTTPNISVHDAIGIDGAGNAYTTAMFAGTTGSGSVVSKVTPSGTSSLLAGGASKFTDGTGSAAGFARPDGFAIDAAGDVFVTDYDTVRKITPSGVVTTIAGSPGVTGSQDGTSSAARFNNPVYLAVDSAGNLYVSDSGNYTVRKVTPGGVVTTLAGTPGVPGSGNGTGTGSVAQFQSMHGIAVDQNGNVFVADGNAIRKITTSGVVSTFAGDPNSYGTTDGIGTAARFWVPWQIAIDSLGNLFVADSSNMTIREVTAAGVVTTIAGKVGTSGHQDGIGSAASFLYPNEIAVNTAGQMYVAEQSGSYIRRLTTIANCPAPTCTSMGPKNITVAGSATTTRFFAYGVQNATIVYFPTWWVDGGNQNDIQWLAGTDDGNGTWHADVPLSQYDASTPRYGNFATHVYMANPDYQSGAAQWCDGTGWVRQAPQPPLAPTVVTGPASSTSTTLTVSWTPSSTGDVATYFELQRGTSTSGPWTSINANIPATTTTYSDTVPGNGTYYYGVAACDALGCSAYTVSSGVVVTLPPAPNPPTVVTVPASSTSATIPVSWTPSSSGSAATYYELQRGNSASGPWTPVNADITTTSYTDTAPAAGTYYYEVAACNAQGCSSYTISANGVNVTGSGGVTLSPLPAAVTDTVPTNDAGTGTMAGQAGTDGGASTYSVPIVVPPGRAGMQPSLSLNYNSRSGDGVMGMGWTISGLSSIHRCPRTMEQDGKTQGVSYGNNDRLCLDGERLVAVSGTYGLSGAQYRTEVDSYARITQVGGDLTGNATCFMVEQKDGRILHYGAVVNGVDSGSPSCASSTANARVQPAGASATLSWLVQQIQDRVGNYQSYAYATSQGSDVFGPGEVLLSTVTYTGFGSTPGNRSVTFAYEPRTTAASGVTDVSSSYLAGGLTMQTQALASITTAVAGVTARVYQPSYVTSAYSGRLLMAKLQECAGSSCSPAQTTCPAISTGSACHPATQFTYNDDALNTAGNFPFVALTGATIPFGTSDQSQMDPLEFHSIGDLDGDGTRESAVTVPGPSGGQNYLVQATADRVIHTAVNLTGTAFDIEPTSYADIDGDGRAKLLELPATNGTLSFGVWSGARGIPPTLSSGNTPAQNFAALFTSYPSNIPFTPGDSYYTGDFNGDGKIDVVRVAFNGGSPCAAGDKAVYIYLNAMTGVLGSVGNTTASFTLTTTPAFCLAVTSGAGYITVQSIDHIGDFNGDGLPDFYLRSDTTGQPAGSSIPATQFYGIEVTQAGGTTATFEPCGAALGLSSDPTTAGGVCTWAQPGQNTNYVTFMDVNGDGLEDIVLARPAQKTWRVILNQGASPTFPNGHYGSEIDTGSSAGLDEDKANDAFRYVGRLPSMDVDSDGHPDLLVPTSDQGQNKNFALKMCTAYQFSFTGTECPGSNKGSPSGATTNVQSCLLYSCPEDPGATTLNMPTAVGAGLVYGTYETNPYVNTASVDNSVYHLAMLKFVQTGASTFSVVSKDTPLVGRLSSGGVLGGRTDSLFGDGLADLTSVVGCTNTQVTYGQNVKTNRCLTVADGMYGPNATLPDGTATSCPLGSTCPFDTNPVLYAGINQGVVANGGSLALRTNSSLQITMAVSGTTPLTGRLFLPGLLNDVINGVGDEAGWDYLPLSTPGAQDGIALYSVPSTGGYVDSRHYYFQSSMPVVDGMAQSAGNGTYGTGFRTAIYGYAQAMYNHFGRGFTGFYQITAESADGNTPTNYRATRTTTTYNQKFPLIGKLAQVQTSARDLKAATNVVVRDETDNYICTLSNRGTCPQDTAIAAAPSTGGTVFAPVLDTQTVKTFDLGSSLQDGEVDTVNANNGASGWDAFGNLTYQTATRYDVGSPQFLSGQTTTTQNSFDTSDTADWWINKLTQSSVTSSIAYSASHTLPSGASASSQTLTTGYTWNTDRTPLTKTVQSGITNQRSTTTYGYPSPSYGLPSSVSVYAPDLSAALSPTRTMQYGYSSDGYFVQTTTNALNQTTTTTHETNDGQVTNATDPNRVQVVTTYDPFGRAIQIQHLNSAGAAIESPIQIAYTPCAGSCAGGYAEDGVGETYSAYRVTTVQAGYPTKVAWFDLLGRQIKTAERGYGGSFIETLTDYDDMGTVIFKFAPFYSGSAQYSTSWTYDALNRPTIKIASASDMDSAHGNFVTDYTYSGRTTNIVAHAANVTCPGSTSNLCETMSRSQNVLGQYMQTTDAKDGITNYWTEPLGHVTAMEDAEGNYTTAQYNALGQRMQSSDPDQGTWNFTYDAFGELLTQKDARGVVTTVTSRDALGRTTQQQAVPPATLPWGMANEAVQDTWVYDQASNGIGELYSATRLRGTNSTAPGSNPMTWQEIYGYDSDSRPSTIATTINEGGSVKLASGMGYDSYGRPSTHTYPDGLVVQTQYGPYGQSGALADGTSGKIWYETTAEDAWGKPTTEKYTDGTVGTTVDFQSSGQEHTASWTLNGSTVVDSLTYSYDSFGNLVSQQRTAGSSINIESYLYDPLQRLTQSARSTGAAVNYGYTGNGNLAYKDDYSVNSGTGTPAYSYASANSTTNGCGPHAANAVALPGSLIANYTCDANGNVYGGSTLGIVYDADNHPRTASRSGGGSVTWAYDANGGMDYESSKSRGVRYFAPDGYEQVGTQGIHELGPIVVTRNGSTDTVTTTLRGRLGSTIDTIDAGFSSAANARSYDAFGAARNGDMSVRPNGTLNLNDTIHGFTKHEHADDVWLIHMGGRIYDYNLGRFLSVDPIIGNPLSSQSLNPYSYIGNNPLSGTDPTGYDCQADNKGQIESSCLESNNGINKITDANGKAVATVVLANKGDNITITGNGGSISATFTGKAGDVSRVLNGGPPSDIGGISKATNGTLDGTAASYAYGQSKPPSQPFDMMAAAQQAQLRADALADQQWTFAHEGMRPGSLFGIDAPIGDLADYLNTAQSSGFFSKAAGVGLLGVGLDAITLGRGGGALGSLEKSALKDAEEGEMLLYRNRAGPESVGRLARQAQAAEDAGLPHGVSVFSRRPSPGTPCGAAKCSEVQAQFGVTQTGRDPAHYTVTLPKPVTKEDAQLFNQMFKDVPNE
ncbi:MAG: NHL domain-containing protein [Rudaea sp.]